jgi:hypothetical protein
MSTIPLIDYDNTALVDASVKRGRATRRWAREKVAHRRKIPIALPASLRYNALVTDEPYIATQSGLRNDTNQQGDVSELSPNGANSPRRLRLLRSTISGTRTDETNSDVRCSTRAEGTEQVSEGCATTQSGLSMFLLRAILGLNRFTRKQTHSPTNALGSRATLRLRKGQPRSEFRGSVPCMQPDQAEQSVPDYRGSEDLHQCEKTRERLQSFSIKNAANVAQSSSQNDLGKSSVPMPAESITGSSAPMLSEQLDSEVIMRELNPPLMSDEERGAGDSTNARMHRILHGKPRLL